MNNMILLSNHVLAQGVPRTLFSIDADTIVFTLINTLLIMLAYYVFLHKPVMAMFEKRKDAIKAEFDEAALIKGQAEADAKKYGELLASSHSESERIITAASAKARSREEEIISKAEATAAQTREKALADIERERKRAVNEIKDQIAGIVVMAASAVAEKEINEEAHAALIESFLAEANAA